MNKPVALHRLCGQTLFGRPGYCDVFLLADDGSYHIKLQDSEGYAYECTPDIESLSEWLTAHGEQTCTTKKVVGLTGDIRKDLEDFIQILEFDRHLARG